MLLAEKTKRMIAVLGVSIIIPLVCFILILLSIKLYIFAEVNSEKVVLDQIKNKYQTSDFLTFKNTIKKGNEALANASEFYQKEIYVTKILKTMSLISRPKSLYITDFSLNRDKNKKIKVIISGFSGSREDLITFKKNIDDTQVIENPSFSPESWVSPDNITFHLTFEISK